MPKYDRGYCCSRDDHVFDPETGSHCAPQDLTKFFYGTYVARVEFLPWLESLLVLSHWHR